MFAQLFLIPIVFSFAVAQNDSNYQYKSTVSNEFVLQQPICYNVNNKLVFSDINISMTADLYFNDVDNYLFNNIVYDVVWTVNLEDSSYPNGYTDLNTININFVDSVGYTQDNINTFMGLTFKFWFDYEDDDAVWYINRGETVLDNGDYEVDTGLIDSSTRVEAQCDFNSYLIQRQFRDYIQSVVEGYPAGYSDGFNAGYTDGYSDGNTDGYQSGYANGYTEGATQDETAVAIFSGIINIALIPINFFLACLNFEVFGINIGAFVTALLTVAIVVIITRVIVSGGNGGGDK